MKNFTYKTLLKYLFLGATIFAFNNLSSSAPISLCLLPAFLSLPFSPLLVFLIYSFLNLFLFSFWQAVYLCFSALFLCVVFALYKRNKKGVKGEFIIYLCIALIPYFLPIFNQNIYAKLVYSAVINAFSLISCIALKVVFNQKLNKKNTQTENAGLYLFLIILSLGIIEILGANIYQTLALCLMLLACRFYKNQTAFIPAFILSLSQSIYLKSFSPIAIFEIYCATVLLFINKSHLLAAIAQAMISISLKYLSGEIFTFTAVDYITTFLPTVIFLFAPQKLFDFLKDKLFCFSKPHVVKQIINYERATLSLKLNQLSSVFSNVQYSLNQFDDLLFTNDNATEKICEECLLNVCSLCPYYLDCVKKGHPKKEDLLKLISVGISKGNVSLIDLSRDFSSYCYSINTMIYEINRLINLYNEQVEKAEQTSKIKGLTSMQAGAVSQILSRLAFDLSCKIEFNEKKELAIFNALLECGIVAKQVICYKDEFHLLFSDYNVDCSKVAKRLSKILCQEIRLNQKIEVHNAIYTVFTKAPAFDASFGVAQLPKKGCAVAGDCHTLTKINEGVFLVALCDGMGSGEKARKNSQTAIDLFETLYKTGMPKENCLDLANKILSVCSSDSFSTLDCAIFNLFTAQCDLIKIGATYGFLIGEKGVKVVENTSLPLGILDQIEPNFNSFTLKNGDFLVIMSDGISDAFFSSTDALDFISQLNCRNAQTLADRILEQALLNYDGEPKDDMTVIVVKIFER